jgi:hypothetical protein
MNVKNGQPNFFSLYLQEIENYVGSLITKDFTDEEMVNIDERLVYNEELNNNNNNNYYYKGNMQLKYKRILIDNNKINNRMILYMRIQDLSATYISKLY